MLYLSRREGQAVIIDNVIEVRVVEVRGRVVKLGFTFPNNVSVLREEVFQEVRLENEAAARAAASFADGLPFELRQGDGDTAADEREESSKRTGERGP